MSGEQHLASLLPQGSKLEAELYVPTRAAGFVRPGTKVLLRYDAFPYQKFGQFKGQVSEVSMTTIPLAELKPAASSEPVYRVRVSLDNQSQPSALKPGVQLSATLVLERRTLMEWIFEPLLGISGSL